MTEPIDHAENDRRIGLFDLDGTLANYEKAMCKWLSALTAPGDPEYEVHSREPASFYERQCVIRRQPGFWRNLEPIELDFQIPMTFPTEQKTDNDKTDWPYLWTCSCGQRFELDTDVVA